MKSLPTGFYKMPRPYNMVMDKAYLKEVLFETGGDILVCGDRWGK
jgi:hypothetical protein